jgi:hypothetical protein
LTRGFNEWQGGQVFRFSLGRRKIRSAAASVALRAESESSDDRRATRMGYARNTAGSIAA